MAAAHSPCLAAACLLVLFAAATQAFLVPTQSAAVARLGRPLPTVSARLNPRLRGVRTLRAAGQFTSKDFNINWARPDAQGSFGRVYFAQQGFMGMGGQVVIKFPLNNNFALNTFETERVVNQRLDSVGSPRWAKYLGDIEMDPSAQTNDIGTKGMVFKRETGESLEDLLVAGKDVGSKIGARGGGTLRPELAKKVMKELFLACQQMHSLDVYHRDIKPENILVTGGNAPLKLIDFGSSCDLASKAGLNQVSLDPIYAPPEKRMQPNQPGKFDIYSVAMTGMRCLLPSLSSDPRPGIDHRNPNCVTLIQVYSLHPTPYTLHPTPYTLHPTPYTLHPTPYTLHPTPYALYPIPCTLNPTPGTLDHLHPKAEIAVRVFRSEP
jgi:serine/threonine protein kinase